jgi:hypothetical protein
MPCSKNYKTLYYAILVKRLSGNGKQLNITRSLYNKTLTTIKKRYSITLLKRIKYCPS